MPSKVRHFVAKPKAGQRQRIGSGTWEEATNRHQRRIVEVFDGWALELKRGINRISIRGGGTPEMSSLLDSQIPILERRLAEIQSAGVNSAVKVSARSRANLPEIRSLAAKLVAENRALIKESLIPRIHEKLTLALAVGAGSDHVQMNQAITTTRPMPAGYSGGYWVAIFETQRRLGEIREGERAANGLLPEPVRWVLDPTAEHCQDSPGYFGCPSLAGEYPGGWFTLKTVPAGTVTCRGNCRCHVEVFKDNQWKRGVYDD